MSEQDQIQKTCLSVVIVTYNSISFIGLALGSLMKNAGSFYETIVVDNNSTDGTADYVEANFPQVKIIRNNTNPGFGKACNQGMHIASGDYFLMLNPDTIVPGNVVDKVLEFMHNHPQCGAMGVKMVDGNGRYLPESKRGLPTLFRSACRMLGLSMLFPKSKQFAGYYLGHLPIDKVNPIEILSGAFMVLRAKTIKQCGGFDERFFMYGEDIDLSWRIKKAGFEVFYNPEIIIIHFKGESTTRDAKYLRIFYEAMDIFYNIHFGSQSNPLYKAFVRILIASMKLISQVRMAATRMFSKDETVFPAEGDFTLISSCNDVWEVLKGKVIVNDAVKVLQPKEHAIENVPNSNFIFDLSSISADFVIDSIDKTGGKGKVLLVNHERDFVLYPVSSSRKTHVISLKTEKLSVFL